MSYNIRSVFPSVTLSSCHYLDNWYDLPENELGIIWEGAVGIRAGNAASSEPKLIGQQYYRRPLCLDYRRRLCLAAKSGQNDILVHPWTASRQSTAGQSAAPPQRGGFGNTGQRLS